MSEKKVRVPQAKKDLAKHINELLGAAMNASGIASRESENLMRLYREAQANKQEALAQALLGIHHRLTEIRHVNHIPVISAEDLA